MQSIHNYDVYIFDCDGVILDSNKLKIEAMEEALRDLGFEATLIEKCIDYFKNNFGLSRFHHVEIFLDKFLNIEPDQKDNIRPKILNKFSDQCHNLYLEAKITPGFIELITSLKGKKYIASGSEEFGLIRAFKERGLEHLFSSIYGSPETKSNIIFKILDKEHSKKAIMFGDAISDFEAAKKNGIDFIAYTPYSNVKDTLIMLATNNGYNVVNSWSEVK
ncbi:HAD family hydrolase [Leclercia sp. M-A074-M]|uniref:HAD family hydrolase n=1 Tax=Leclercia sp. M-A074-M TaxID=3402294 RepID=UPI003B262E3F